MQFGTLENLALGKGDAPCDPRKVNEMLYEFMLPFLQELRLGKLKPRTVEYSETLKEIFLNQFRAYYMLWAEHTPSYWPLAMKGETCRDKILMRKRSKALRKVWSETYIGGKQRNEPAPGEAPSA